MSLAIQLHDLIEKHNVLQKPTERLNECFWNNRNLYKAVLLINHVFRAAMMNAMMVLLPLSRLTNGVICFVGSLFYRLTVETNCAYKFALPSLAGAIAWISAKKGVIALVNGTAFASLKTFVLASLSVIPLCAYAAYIVLTVSYDVDHR